MKQVTSANLIPLCILRILEKYTDAQSPITQQALGEQLQRDYGITCERKALGRTLRRMREELDLDIRSGRKGCWLGSRTFTDEELLLLVNLVRACGDLGEAEKSGLVDKLCSLAGINFGYQVKRQLRGREPDDVFYLTMPEEYRMAEAS